MAKKAPAPRNKYPFADMTIGDTVSIKVKDPSDGTRAACAAYAYGRRNGVKFCTLSETRRGKQYMTISRYE